jgi:hypothetical protein
LPDGRPGSSGRPLPTPIEAFRYPLPAKTKALDTAPQRAKPRHRQFARVIEDLTVQGDIQVQGRDGAMELFRRLCQHRYAAAPLQRDELLQVQVPVECLGRQAFGDR